MSYSFFTKAETKSELLTNIGSELDKVVENQPIHAKDRDTHEAVARSVAELVRDPKDDELITASINGSCWQREGDEGLNAASVGVTIGFVDKEHSA